MYATKHGQEILTFCTKYIDNIETRWNPPLCVDDERDDTYNILKLHIRNN